MLIHLVWYVAQDPAEAEMTLSWPVLMGGVAAACTVLAMLLGGLIWLIRTTVRAETDPMKRVADKTQEMAVKTLREVSTHNGNTVGKLTEDNHSALEELLGISRDNRTLIADVSRRLDEHVVRGHAP